MHVFLVVISCLSIFLGACLHADELTPLPHFPVEKTVDQELAKYLPVPAPDQAVSVGLITIGGHESEINQATWLYVKNALDFYKVHKPAFIILELNTPGGEVFSAQKISDALKEMDTQLGIPVVAFIDNWAISAGAMLAYSCRFIAIVKDASMGAAEPLTVESGKAEPASEKINSAIRADFANRAQYFDRNPAIAEAMVDKDTILVMRKGTIIKIEQESQFISTGPDPDVWIKPKGKLLTLTAEQMMRYGVADILVPPAKLVPITAEEIEKGSWPASKNLLFTTPYFEKFSHATIDEYRMDWKGRFFAFLSHPLISSLIFLGMILGFYIEINTPGFGLPGTVGVTCLFLIILSSFALEIANWLELIFLLSGLSILMLELFVLPTFGLLGFIGILLFFAGLLGMMLPGLGSIHYEFDSQTFNAAGEVFIQRLAWVSGTLLAGFILILILSRYMTLNLGPLRRFVLVGHEQEGYSAVDKGSDLPSAGSEGVTLTALRPSGKIIVSDKIYDAISYGIFIEKDKKIVVDRVEGGTIVVHELTE